MEFYVHTNADAVVRTLQEVEKRQVPFATALALTNMAKRVQNIERRVLEKKFTLRNPRVSRGVQTVPAAKSKWPRTFSQVGSRDEFMVLHETGGTKAAKRAKRIAIPQGEVHRLRAPQGGVRPHLKPRRLLAKMEAAKAETKSRGRGRKRRLPFLLRSKRSGNWLIVRRQGRGRNPLDILHAFRASARIDPRWNFYLNAKIAVAEIYGDEFRDALAFALRTVRTS